MRIRLQTISMRTVLASLALMIGLSAGSLSVLTSAAPTSSLERPAVQPGSSPMAAADHRGSGRLTFETAYRGSGRLTQSVAHRGSGRLLAYRGSGRLTT